MNLGLIILLLFFHSTQANKAIEFPQLVRAKQCCYSDACNKNQICSDVGNILKDSCPRNYLVEADCSLTSTECCYIDACNKHTICALKNGLLTDSCHRVYNVSEDCKLSLNGCCSNNKCTKIEVEQCDKSFSFKKPPCCYTDACDKSTTICSQTGKILRDSCEKSYFVNFDCSLKEAKCCYLDSCNKNNRICGASGEILTDKCNRSSFIDDKCKLTRADCCYFDGCSNERICAPKNGILQDSCPQSYHVSNDCSLSRECCFIDACNKKTICSTKDGLLTDSCNRIYHVSNTCKLSKVTCCEKDQCSTFQDRRCTNLDFLDFQGTTFENQDIYCRGFKTIFSNQRQSQCQYQISEQLNSINIAMEGTKVALNESLINNNVTDLISISIQIDHPESLRSLNLNREVLRNHCFAHVCHVKVTVYTNKFYRKAILENAFGQLQKKPQWSSIYKEENADVKVEKHLNNNQKTYYVVVLKFSKNILAV